MDGIITPKLQDKIFREKHLEKTVPLFLDELERKVDIHPQTLWKILERMNHFDGSLRTLARDMKEAAKVDDEDITTG